MAKKSVKSKKLNVKSSADAIANAKESDLIKNGLEGVLFSGGMPGGVGIPGLNSASVSQVGNIFENLRWYFISNFLQPLSEAYVELGLIQTLVDVPVEDGLRGGVRITTKQLTPDQLELLYMITEREQDLAHIGDGIKWTRLYGGGGVLILSNQPADMPLNLAALGPGTPLEFKAVDMWQLSGYGTEAVDLRTTEFFDYEGLKVHKSRIIVMVGKQAPAFLRPKLRGWGFSLVEQLVRSINQYLEGTDLIYELIGEAKIDVYGIKNLTNTLLNPGASEAVAKRVAIANQQKDYQHAIVMDSEDSYQQKTLTFSGLAEVMNQVRMQVASDLRMPITKLFGISAAGFNSGEDDIEVYNSMIESTVRTKAKFAIMKVLQLRCQNLFGMVPSDLGIEFEPLRVLSSEQEEKVKTEKFNRLSQALAAGAISLEEFRDACNKENLLEIQLDNEKLMEGADEVTGVPGGESEEAEADEQANDAQDAAVAEEG